MDPISVVADEVALEGLDGITLPTLWIRLEDRKPKFPLQLDDCTREFIWKSLIGNPDLRFYQLPQEREDVVLFDRYKDIDPETGIEKTQRSPDTWKDIYPVHIIENHNGIQGSCAVFKQRRDVTKDVRSPLVNLQEALERYGRKLVVVASQKLRFRALIGSESDPDMILNDDSYCVLERVGRGRWQGELQKDLHGQSFKIDARKLFYMRKSLVRHGLITMQSHCTRLKSGQQQSSILLLLKRFHVNRRTKYDVLMECVSNILQQSPDQLITLIALKQQLNVNDQSLKRVLLYMRSAKLIEYFKCPLEDLDPSAGPCINKKGSKVHVRCLKLLKPYSKKNVPDDDDDDDDEDDDDSEGKIRATPSEGRLMERDVLSQAYHFVLSCGTKGVPQRGIGLRMNVGKLEARMICRRLERDGAIKGFMEDEGRQRTTKFISHKFVGVSDRLRLFAKERERTKRLCSSASQASDPATTAAASTSKPPAKQNSKALGEKKSQNAGGGGSEEAKEPPGTSGDVEAETTGESSGGNRGKAKRKSGAKRVTAEKKKGVKRKQPQSEAPACSESTATTLSPSPGAEQPLLEEEEESPSSPAVSSPRNKELNAAVNNIVEVKDQTLKCVKSGQPAEKSRDTYRLLRRKNLIMEAVHNMKIIEGLFPLQKMINEEEKQDGLVTKCCKKTILRLVHRLSREGLLKFYNTTVIQDGITKKVELVVHPSIQPNDDIVNRTIEQIRFKISSSYTALRVQQEEKAREEERKADKTKQALKWNFKPETVRGLGKSFGFQPKMPRLRVIHNFLWYLIYGHAHQYESTASQSTSQTPDNPDSSHPDALCNLDVTSSGDEEDDPKESEPAASETLFKVYVDDDSWKRFIPPVRLHKEFGSGWAMVGDALLCLPLSLFIQVTQINYKVDGLEEYLNDPIMQHRLIRTLPAKMKRQLLYKRKYIFSFHENLQKLVYMGLLQFGPVEKFKEKDQVFVYLKRKATIVDTTSAEAHYWLVTEPPDKPFDRRQYTFNTTEEVENYWFDLMCVCLNTPLGVIRCKRNVSEEEADPSFVHERNVFIGLAYMLKGSREVCDDGSIPGDGKGAAGLDSEFFGHLKRNWFWTNRLLTCKTTQSDVAAKENKVRLKSLLSRNTLRIALRAGGTTEPRYVTTKRMLITEDVTQVRVEPATRNQQVLGGKGQKRKRSKKEVVKTSRKKKKEPAKRTPAHDEADHKALKMMTRQRVFWSVQEDSLMMLCSVASHLLNSKLKRPFVPHCVVRDLLHSEFEKSMDKTSVAVGRRTRYILKNPQAILNCKICLAEVYQDKALMNLLEEKKPANPDNPENCAQVFSEYVRLLRQKYSSALTPGDAALPDTKRQLFERFKVSSIQSGGQLPCRDTLNCTDDIHSIVLHNLIQSTLAMNNSQMKSSRSFQTFQLYSKYDQELLCQVFLQCRRRGLVNRRRINQSGPKKNRALPILPMSYQLSQSYYRCFSSRFPPPLCTDAFRFLRSLMKCRSGDDRPVTEFYLETEDRSDSREEAPGRRTERKRKQSKEKEAGGAEDLPKKANDESAKEEESDGSRVEGEQQTGTERNDPAGSSAAGSAPPSTEQTANRPPRAAASNAASGGPADMMPFSLDSPGGTCVVSLSLMSLGLLSVYVSIPKQIVVVDSSLVDNDVVKSMAALEDEEDDDDDDGEECEGRKKLEVKAHQASHTNYLMMRGYCSPGIVKRRGLNTADSIVVESCLVRLKLRDTPAHHVFMGVENVSTLDLTKYGPSLLPSNLTYSTRFSPASPSGVTELDSRLVQRRGYTPQDADACVQLMRSLDAAGEKGLEVHDLYQTHDHLEEPQSGRTRSLQQYLKELQEECQVLQVGSMSVRWVLMRHAEPWLLIVKSTPLSQSRLTPDILQRRCNIPFTRKRRRREVRREEEEPPVKKSAGDKQEGEEREEAEKSSGGGTKEKLNEEDELRGQRARGDEGDGGTLMNLEGEGETQKQPEEERVQQAGSEEMETEEKKEPVFGEEGLDSESDGRRCSAPTQAADEDENVSFISRPWRMVDGGLNRPVGKGMLEAVLFHIMSQPGLTLQTLMEHYRNVLQPVALLDLVQALIEMGCLSRKTLVKAPKPSLFSRSTGTRSETRMKVEEPDRVYYEPTISCVLRLSQALPNERHWNNWLP